MTTYLLEKTRVARQLDGERSYHVFYQLCAGANDEMRERLGLKEASEFRSLVSRAEQTFLDWVYATCYAWGSPLFL